MDTFELRVVCYTDTDAESAPGGAKKIRAIPGARGELDLTAARATALSRYFRDQTQLPFLNVIVTGRGDSEPIGPDAGNESAHNRRVEITGDSPARAISCAGCGQFGDAGGKSAATSTAPVTPARRTRSRR